MNTTQGFAGGFFLPAQRSVHCKGGFFSSSTTAASSHAKASFPVLFTLPQAPVPENSGAKPHGRRVYDPHEGDDDEERGTHDSKKLPQTPEMEIVRERKDKTPKRFVRSRQPPQMPGTDGPRTSSSRSSNNATREVPVTRPRQQVDSEKQQPKGDINSKFEIAMKELNQIKDEFDLKQQRQHSAPVLPTRPSETSTPHSTKSPPPKGPEQAPAPLQATATEQPTPRTLQSPRQRLQVAEMVMRKLYKKNLQTEQTLATVQAENAALAKKLAALEAGKAPDPTVACARCSMNNAVGVVLANPPSMETISHIDQQQLEYLRHLAAEQDRTITSLKLRIEELSVQRTMPTTSKKTSTPRQALTKLQGKLQDALTESERQKTNYRQLKRDFQHLLALKTKTLYDNPTQLDASAKQLVALMDKQLQQLETEHAMNLSLYNSKLYETEQQSCESYAQQRMLQEEMDRVARDVQQRDALDVEIEQCMANVFARLHDVERENVLLKQATSGARSSK